jgi:hypothetical protein
MESRSLQKTVDLRSDAIIARIRAEDSLHEDVGFDWQGAQPSIIYFPRGD